MSIRYVTIHIDPIKFPKNVRADQVRRIFPAPYGGFGRKGEWVPTTKNGGIATIAFADHSFSSKLLDRYAARIPNENVNFEIWP